MEKCKRQEVELPKKSGEQKKACKFQPIQAKEKHGATGEPSIQRTSGMETKRKRPKKDDKASCPQKMAQANKRVSVHKKIPIPPLPTHLPPVNLIYRGVVRAWCQQLKLSTSGQEWKRECAYSTSGYSYHTRRGKDIDISTKEIEDEKGGQFWSSRSDCSPGEAGLLLKGELLLSLREWAIFSIAATDWEDLGRWRPRSHHRRPLVASGVCSMDKVSLQIQRVGFSYSFMLGKPGSLRNQGKCVHSSWYLPITFHATPRG
ncbi:hypothetical protein QTO34_001624 [Cnephaeus nilssonii]|uniref:Uncharacterized protein n=1 Tax=Cnephaeus nilssonii TaxID=3371016 RepID=A0AA40LNP9_CNENI|nr:hypothetical protein QTO34_001624 [Eptesicus nilssonii]